MSAKMIILLGGLASFVTLAAWVAMFALVPDMNFDNLSSTASAILTAGSIATMVAFAGMYYLFADLGSLRLWMLVLGVIGVGLTLVPSDSGWTYSVGTILWGVALVVAGYLVRAGSFSAWLSWLGMIGGALFVVAGAVYLAGSTDLGDTLNFVSSIPVLIWTAWIGWVMVKKSREVSPA